MSIRRAVRLHRADDDSRHAPQHNLNAFDLSQRMLGLFRPNMIQRFRARQESAPRPVGAKIIMISLVQAKASFGDLLRQVLIVEKQQPLQPVAASLGLTVHGFCSRLRNGGRLDPDEVAIILRVVADERLPQWFFANTGLLLVKHTVALPDGSHMTLRQRAAACAVDAISAICDLADTLEAGRMEGLQKTMIEDRLDHALGVLLSIQLRLAPPPAEVDVAPNGASHEDFAGLIRRVLLTDRVIRLQALAESLNLNYQALHARMLGHVAFLPVELRQLFRMFPDPRLAEYLLAGTPYTAILRPAVIESRVDSGPIQTGLLSLREMVQFLEALVSAEERPGSALPATVDPHLDEAVRHLTTLRWNMTYIGHHNAPRTQAGSIKGADAA